MFGLVTLPYEVLANIAENLTFDDVFSLGRTCKDFLFLINEERICKSFVQNKIKYATEALAAAKSGGNNARALRRAAKRRDALATAKPFVIATVGFCDDYIYSKGVLCYTLDEKLRILDLHRSAQEEVVVSIPGLLTQALAEISDSSQGRFRCLYYSDGIVSCLYDALDDDSPAWLIAFHIRSRNIVVAHELESTNKIFVRNDKQYLYFGTHSELGTDGFKKWVVSGYEYKTRKWFDQKVHLPDMVGSEIGSTVCFEFHNGYFYALSNQTSFEVEEIDWTSFYHCVRFPLNSPCKPLIEKTKNENMWRRQHQEGPIDDRWTSLRLDEDEGTGELRIVEARKEWYLGSSKSQRTYYTTDIVFQDPPKDDDNPSVSSYAVSMQSNLLIPATSDESISTGASSSSAPSARMASESTAMASTSSTTASSTNKTDTSALPNEPITRLIKDDDHPHYTHAQDRRPERTHPSNDGEQTTHTLTKSRIRTYHTPCSTFLDLVDDPLPDDWEGKQRLRLRVGSRKPREPLKDERDFLRHPNPNLNIALEELYTVAPITYWPNPQNLLQPNVHDDAVYRLMNPPSHLGNVDGISDERSLIYATGGRDQPQALIFVGFDPAIKLAGIKQWGGLPKAASAQTRGGGTHDAHADEREVFVDEGEADRSVGIDRKGKGKASLMSGPIVQVGAASWNVDVIESVNAPGGRSRAGRNSSWAWREPAMYRDINLGFYFGWDKS